MHASASTSSKAVVSLRTERGLRIIVLENDELRVAMLPEVGGKVIEVTDRRSGYQFLLPPQSADGWYSQGMYGADFSHSDVSGFDECFPTVSPSGAFPDHGELWSRPWAYEIEGESVILSIDGVHEAYRFERRMRLNGNRIRFDYRVTNNAAEAFPFVWSAHPLLKVSEGSQIILPKSVQEVFINWASDPAAAGAYGDIRPWPSLSAEGTQTAADYARVPSPGRGIAVKCFTPRLDEGYAGFYEPAAGQSILFEFDTKEIPYLGLWLCYGGWPEGGRKKQYTVGLEPCTGRPDALSEAIARDECDRIPAGGTRTWSFDLSVWKKMPTIMRH